MKVLLTGGLGFIGSHTIIELVNSNFEIVILDNLYNSKIEVLEKVKNISCNENIKFIKGDILNLNDIDLAMAENVNCVIHFAALKAVNESIKKPLEYYNSNISGLINILKKCKEHNVDNFIFSSSATVYGSSLSPLKEDSNVGDGITNPYGQTKFMAEVILNDYCKANPNFNVICLRYFNPVGAHKSGLIGEDPNDIPNNLMPYVLKVAVKNNLDNKLDDCYSYLSIFGNDYDTHDGTCKRDFIHVVDLANAHVKACTEIGKFNNFEVFNIGTGKGTSVLDLVLTFKHVNDIEIPFIFKDRRDGDSPVTYCDCSKAKDLLKWEAKLNMEDICLDTYNFAKSNYRSKYTFIHPTKSGGTAIEKYFIKNYSEYIEGRGHDNVCSNTNNPIIVVRSVESRFLSMYKYWKYGAVDTRYKRDNNFKTKYKNTNIIKFINFLKNKDHYHLHKGFTWANHFEPTSNWIKDTDYSNIIIIKYEKNLNNKIQKLINSLKIPNKNINLPIINETAAWHYIEEDIFKDEYINNFVHDYFKDDYKLIDIINSKPELFRSVI